MSAQFIAALCLREAACRKAPPAPQHMAKRNEPTHVTCSAAAAAADGSFGSGAPPPSSGNGASTAAVDAAAAVPGKYQPVKRAPLDDRYIRQLIFSQRKHLFIAAAALLVCTTCNLISPIITGFLFEMLVGRGGYALHQYPKFFAVFTAIYVLEPLLTRVYIRNMCAAGEKVLATVRRELFRTLLLQRIDFFDRHDAAELTSLINTELDSLRALVFNNVSRDRGPRAILEASGAVAVLFALSWRLGPILAIVIVGSAFTAALYKQQTKAVEGANASALSRMSSVASQAFYGIRTVRSFAGEALERERFGQYVDSSYKSGLSFAEAKANLESINRGAVHFSLLAVYSWGGWLVARGLLPVRLLLTAIGYTFALIFSTQGAIQSTADLRKATAAIRRIQELLASSSPDPSMAGALPPGAWWEYANTNTAMPIDAQPYGPNAGNGAVDAARHGNLRMVDLSFSYPLRPNSGVLKGLNLELPRGTSTAVVGRSGAGKSTIASLLSRFYDPDQGAIFLGEEPATKFTRGEWAKCVALVSQEPVLFAGTIEDNIAYGRYGRCSRDEVEQAARDANAHDFIMELPEGYHTSVGDRGSLLSGGQRQRIAIARALIKDSPILILDEATSALDAVSERLVQSAVDRLVTGRTVLIIAHRLSTVQAADQICVLDSGRVVEIGTHAELSAKPDGEYTRLITPSRSRYPVDASTFNHSSE
eukprot:CAMPEP_0206138586 /NCGR_PEP_ID=MMETSP1473-20131121/3425_1 /ASSEMBLY_ACC=CAM_ASM_001109 /TAXON_ID=1461547 /ORGANISM="Stichococcus sp, Strain RCC1054" /LENGTH=706 /DNA_ID=CAMNT_0053532061 /DNA_START=385 /DNA_END=2508 /DNA_ORIENTATION=+